MGSIATPPAPLFKPYREEVIKGWDKIWDLG